MVKYTKNDDYFKGKTEEVAYVAGFTAADGNVRSYPSRLAYTLKSTDRIVLETIREVIAYTGPIRNTVHKAYTLKKDSGYVKAGYTIPKRYGVRLQIYAAQTFVQDLNTIWNITPKKSLILLPPNITDTNLIKAYTVGYFDGDGCLNWNISYNTFSIRVLGTFEMMSWMKEILEDLTNEHFTLRRKTTNNTWSLEKGGKGVLKFVEALSNVNVPRLERKWNLAEVERLGRLRKEQRLHVQNMA